MGGAGTYVGGFVQGLIDGEIPDRSSIVVVVSASWAATNEDSLEALRSCGVAIVVASVPEAGTWRARLGRGRLLDQEASIHRCTVAYVPRDTAPRIGIPCVMLARNRYAWQRYSSCAAVGGTLSAALLRFAARRSAGRAVAVLAVSETFAKSLAARVTVTGVVHHGCSMEESDRSRPAPDVDGTLAVTMIANVTANKGIEVVIEGVARAVAAGRPASLEVYGKKVDRAYSDRLEELALARLGASPFRGAAFGGELVRAYRNSHILAVGGSFETFCLPLLEGMRNGCVVVAPQGPLVDEICGDAAVLYTEGDPESFARALARAAEDWAERSYRGIQLSRDFTWARTVERTLRYVRQSTRKPPARILVDLSVSPVGGAATYVAGFAQGLVDGVVPDRSSIVVLLPEAWATANGQAVDALRSAGVTVDVVEVLEPGTWEARLTRGRLIRRAVKRNCCTGAYIPRDLAPRIGVPYVMLSHNQYAWHRFSSYTAIGGSASAFLLRVLARRSAARAAAVITVSGTFAGSLSGKVALAGVVHHGCTIEEQHRTGYGLSGDDVLIVIMIANITSNKGIEVVIDGVSEAVARGRASALSVYGGRTDFGYARRLEEQASARLGSSPFRGPVFGDDLVAVYRQSHIVAIGGSFETFCFPLLEGMRTGCVVVAPRSQLVEEICGDAAVVYTEGDAASFARALEVAAEEWTARSERGMQRARRFSWADTVEKTMEHVRASLVGL